MVRKGEYVKQGDLYAGERRTGVRASIVALTRRNGRRAKGGRKVGELQSATRNTHRHRVAFWPRRPETSAVISRTNRVLHWNLTLTTSVMEETDLVLCPVWDVLSSASFTWLVSPLWGDPPTGEPYAGDPHVRFGGGSGQVTGCSYPYPFSKRHLSQPDIIFDTCYKRRLFAP